MELDCRICTTLATSRHGPWRYLRASRFRLAIRADLLVPMLYATGLAGLSTSRRVCLPSSGFRPPRARFLPPQPPPSPRRLLLRRLISSDLISQYGLSYNSRFFARSVVAFIDIEASKSSLGSNLPLEAASNWPAQLNSLPKGGLHELDGSLPSRGASRDYFCVAARGAAETVALSKSCVVWCSVRLKPVNRDCTSCVVTLPALASLRRSFQLICF